MRPIQLLLSLAPTFIVILLLYATLGSQKDEHLEQDSAPRKGSVKAMFSFTSPGALFPPSAIISLTDDNSTFFLARPADFGPSLPKKGLSGALWIGSGFGDDTLGQGELGCGDNPDWDIASNHLKRDSETRPHSPFQQESSGGTKDIPIRIVDMDESEISRSRPTSDDGTDNHLNDFSGSKPKIKHSNIQTLQESAEIEGKVALLKRGGCGFLAKVLWAQKRGAVAVIVGDNVRGGPLIRMYAKGDTSNVTIPSLFTSYTTAHLLSSLLPEGATSGRLLGKVAKEKIRKAGSSGLDNGKADKNPTGKIPSSRHYSPKLGRKEQQTSTHNVDHGSSRSSSWMDSILSALGLHKSDRNIYKADSRRPPSSGDLRWAELADWDEDQEPLKTRSDAIRPTATSSDGFAIGKQDWRDPNLFSVPASTGPAQVTDSPSPTATVPGDRALPGSGEYPSPAVLDSEHDAGWNKWFGSKDTVSASGSKHANSNSISSMIDADLNSVPISTDHPAPHEGLWVTLSPSNVSTSPFFDTLLVLVVSPLVTLTVVYILLLLRSRIRRRRWRAPKSLVERLPVRTYQTMSDSTSSATPSTSSSPTTPLLQQNSSPPTSSGQSPQSPNGEDIPATSSSLQTRARTREEEKRETGLAEWRRRYGGRQKECVVCLEDYVDGVSQVMSLPCGHEFHADCITPWLVTRRRTCPICKGDVVRSLAQSYHDRSPSPTRTRLHLDNVDNIQAQAAEMRNDSASASLPMPISASMTASLNPRLFENDVEANWSGNESRRNSGDATANRGINLSTSVRELSTTVSTVVWRGVEAVRNTTGFQRRPPPEDVDRDR